MVSQYNTLIQNNQIIRDYAINNNKTLYDWWDIEHYDPDGKYYDIVDDYCRYYNPSFVEQGNWCTEWQNNHTQGVDWYNSASAHSLPLNANQKAYAFWYMLARMAFLISLKFS